jgi:hypothetical protein
VRISDKFSTGLLRVNLIFSSHNYGPVNSPALGVVNPIDDEENQGLNSLSPESSRHLKTMIIEPEDFSGDHSNRWKKGSFPAIGTAEHTALVEAIRLNFPEIYENPVVPPSSREYRELASVSLVMSSSASA